MRLATTLACVLILLLPSAAALPSVDHSDECYDQDIGGWEDEYDPETQTWHQEYWSYDGEGCWRSDSVGFTLTSGDEDVVRVSVRDDAWNGSYFTEWHRVEGNPSGGSSSGFSGYGVGRVESRTAYVDAAGTTVGGGTVCREGGWSSAHEHNSGSAHEGSGHYSSRSWSGSTCGEFVGGWTPLGGAGASRTSGCSAERVRDAGYHWASRDGTVTSTITEEGVNEEFCGERAEADAGVASVDVRDGQWCDQSYQWTNADGWNTRRCGEGRRADVEAAGERMSVLDGDECMDYWSVDGPRYAAGNECTSGPRVESRLASVHWGHAHGYVVVYEDGNWTWESHDDEGLIVDAAGSRTVVPLVLP